MRKNEIYYANPDPTVGAEINKTRPCIIVSPDEMNSTLRTVIIVPITSQERELPTRVLLDLKGTGLEKESWAVLDQIRVIDKSRLQSKIGSISRKKAEEISFRLCEMLKA